MKLLPEPARERPLRAAWQIGKSVVRRRVPRLRQAVVPYDENRCRIAVDLTTPLGLRLYRYPYTEPEIDLVRALLKSGDIFVDGGANVGLYALVAASRVGPTGRVIAFEPATSTRKRLEGNASLNRFDWIDVRAQALGEGPDERDFWIFDDERMGLSSFAPAGAEQARCERVHTVQLDAALSDDQLGRVTVVKLDLEGAEVSALRGAEKTLRHGPDVIVEVEPAHLARQGANAGELFELLRGHGYGFFRALRGGPGSVHTERLSDDAIAEGFSGNVFATRGSGIVPAKS